MDPLLVYGRAFGLGLVSGLRSMMGAAALQSRKHDAAGGALVLAAAGELIGDKLPVTPPRTAIPSLAFRAITGAFCGWTIARDEHADERVGAAVGALGAVAGSFLGMNVRLGVERATGLPDFPVALGEDAIAILSASLLRPN